MSTACTAGRGRSSTISTVRARLMLVEDDPEMAHAMRYVLEQERYEVRVCADASEALSALREKPLPDLILLDLWTPTMNGWQFRVEQKREPAWARIPTVAMSADRSAHAAAIDADRFLAKPVTQSTLLSAVEQLLRSKPPVNNEPLATAQRAPSAEDNWNALYMALSDLGDARAHAKMLVAELKGFSAARTIALDVLLERAEACTRRALSDCDRALLPVTGASGVEDRERSLQFADLNAFLDAVDPNAGAAIAPLARNDQWLDARHSACRSSADPLLLLARCLRGLRDELPVGMRFALEANGAPLVRAEPAALAQVLRNVLRNAVEALTGVDQPTLRLTIIVYAKAVEIRVFDSGRGAPLRELERAFDPFFTTKADHAGLGLTVARRLATRLDARLDLEREDGGGTSVRLLLPIATHGNESLGAPVAPRSTLLLLHHPERSRPLQMALAEHFNVVCMGPEEAIRHLLGGASYDMVLCSLVLPEMTGVSFASALSMTRPAQAERLVVLVPPNFGPETGKLLDQLHIWHVDEGLPAPELGDSLSGLLRLWRSLGFR